MASGIPETGRALRTLVTANGTVEVSVQEAPIPELGPGDVLVRVEAAPVNPSDLGILFAGADMTAATVSGSWEQPVLTAPLSPGAVRALAARVGKPLPAGNEGAGTVVAAGTSDAAQALIGRAVAVAGGGMYADYRRADAAQCLVLPADVTPRQGASSFINPMTALGMVETMRREGHTALVHTAAASNLGQMLNRVCAEDKVPLVNIVRSAAQEEILRALGAEYVCNSTSPAFAAELTAALEATSATLAFDAVGGGELAGTILGCMEAAAAKDAPGYSVYGTATRKQVYIYGGLDRGPTIVHRTFGLTWGLGGWLLTPFLQTIGPDRFRELRERVGAGLTTTFASSYTQEVSLAGALQPEAVAAYTRQATGEKFVIAPQSG
jgi:NADPH2:quinone reductase